MSTAFNYDECKAKIHKLLPLFCFNSTLCSTQISDGLPGTCTQFCAFLPPPGHMQPQPHNQILGRPLLCGTCLFHGNYLVMGLHVTIY